MKHWAQRLLFFCWKAWGWEGEKNSFRATALWEGFIGDLFLFFVAICNICSASLGASQLHEVKKTLSRRFIFYYT
jgi:hypothetical protein